MVCNENLERETEKCDLSYVDGRELYLIDPSITIRRKA